MTKDLIEQLKKWISDYFKKNTWAKGVVIGMSGGKDSTLCAKLCTEVLGTSRVLGVMVPNGEMTEILDAINACRYLGINYMTVNIGYSCSNYIEELNKGFYDNKNIMLSQKSLSHIEPRFRMTTLYAVASNLDYLVVNTTNMTKNMIGFSTKWGDNVGDFAPLIKLTKSEVVEMSHYYMLPNFNINQTYLDNLVANADKYDLEYNYQEMDDFIRYGKTSDRDLVKRVVSYYRKNVHKHIETPSFDPKLPVFLEELQTN